jgi:hypothetical protein
MLSYKHISIYSSALSTQLHTPLVDAVIALTNKATSHANDCLFEHPTKTKTEDVMEPSNNGLLKCPHLFLVTLPKRASLSHVVEDPLLEVVDLRVHARPESPARPASPRHAPRHHPHQLPPALGVPHHQGPARVTLGKRRNRKKFNQRRGFGLNI